MAITAIEIEGFGPFSSRQRIPLAPLTLLFGPNSAGKTTLFRAIDYAQHCLLKAVPPEQESVFCPGFDLFSPPQRFSDDQFESPLKHCVRFIADEATGKRRGKHVSQPTSNPYVEIITTGRDRQYGDGFDTEIAIEVGANDVPLVYANDLSSLSPVYSVNFCHPLFSLAPAGRFASELDRVLLNKLEDDAQESFGILDALNPALRDRNQEVFLRSRKIHAEALGLESLDPVTCVDGGDLLVTEPIDSWLEQASDGIEVIGELRGYTLGNEDAPALRYPHLLGCTLLISKARSTESRVRLVGLLVPPETSIQDLWDDRKRFLESNPGFRPFHLKVIPFIVVDEKIVNPNFLDEIAGQLLPEDRSFAPWFSTGDLKACLGWGIHIETGNNGFSINTLASYLLKSHPKESGDALWKLVRALHDCFTSILSTFVWAALQTVHIGPVRKLPGPTDSSGLGWYQGEAAWRPEHNFMPQEIAMRPLNQAFERLGINYEVHAAFHRDFRDLVQWLEQAQANYDVLRYESMEPGRQHEILDIFREDNGIEMLVNCASRLKRLAELGVFDSDRESAPHIPACFGASPLDRFKFRPIVAGGAAGSMDQYVTLLGADQLGEGVRQVFPVIRLVVAQRSQHHCPGLTILQQPELHLHPRMQMGVADVLIEHRNATLVETHSEHIILRVLRRIRESATGRHEGTALFIRPGDVSVIYLEPMPIAEAPEAGVRRDAVRVRHLRITEDGDFLDPWPQGFFEERIEDLFAGEEDA